MTSLDDDADAALSLGIDVGGSAIKLGVTNREGTIEARHSLSYRGFETFEDLVGTLADTARALERQLRRTVVAVGLCTPGFSDPLTGQLVDGASNVALLRDRSLSEALRSCGLPVRCGLNDGVAAALGEHRFGAACGLGRFALVTFGTGIGGCVVVNGAPVVGSRGEPPEIGAMVLDPDGPEGPSGLRGSFEVLASASGFLRSYAAAGGRSAETVRELFACAARGEPAAEEAIDGTCRFIAQALATLVNIMGLQAIVIGGGISHAGPALLRRVEGHMPRFTWPMLLDQTRLVVAARGNDAGVLGAASEAMRFYG